MIKQSIPRVRFNDSRPPTWEVGEEATEGGEAVPVEPLQGVLWRRRG